MAVVQPYDIGLQNLADVQLRKMGLHLSEATPYYRGQNSKFSAEKAGQIHPILKDLPKIPATDAQGNGKCLRQAINRLRLGLEFPEAKEMLPKGKIQSNAILTQLLFPFRNHKRRL